MEEGVTNTKEAPMKKVSKINKKSLAKVISLGSVMEELIRENLREFVFTQGMAFAASGARTRARRALWGAV